MNSEEFCMSLQLFVFLLRQTDKVKTKKEKKMKTYLLLSFVAVMLSVSGCRVNIGDGVTEVIEPSENIVKAKYPQEAFDKVDNHVVGTIQLVQSDKSRVTLSAPENYIDFFEFENKGGKLDIKFAKKGINIDTKDVVIIVYTPNLREVTNSGAAELHLDSLTTDEFQVINSGVGSLELNNINAQKIEVSCSGVGSINIDGETDEAEYSCSGVGSIHAKEMKARQVKANVGGVGGIDCYASDDIKGRVTGVGSLNYAGHPEKTDLHHNMTGGINEID